MLPGVRPDLPDGRFVLVPAILMRRTGGAWCHTTFQQGFVFGPASRFGIRIIHYPFQAAILVHSSVGDDPRDRTADGDQGISCQVAHRHGEGREKAGTRIGHSIAKATP